MNNRDHHKEYFYRIFKGQKKYYRRTPNGHKKIAKSKIPAQFIDKIETCDLNDRNWLKSRSVYVKKLNKTICKLNNIDNLNLSQKNYTKTKRILEEDIAFYNETIQYYEREHVAEFQKRYQKETGKRCGFERQEKEDREKREREKQRRERINREKQRRERINRENKRREKRKERRYWKEHKRKERGNRYHNPQKHFNSYRSYAVLTREGIIKDTNTPLRIAIKNYRRWMIKHHPDKGGNTQRCMQVNSEFEHLKNNK